MTPRITLYTTSWCAACLRAKALLDAHEIDYDEIDLDDDPAFRARVFELSGRMTVPLVLLDDEPVGGYRELALLASAGKLPGTRAA
jgi:glutaredoxin 3